MVFDKKDKITISQLLDEISAASKEIGDIAKRITKKGDQIDKIRSKTHRS